MEWIVAVDIWRAGRGYGRLPVNRAARVGWVQWIAAINVRRCAGCRGRYRRRSAPIKARVERVAGVRVGLRRRGDRYDCESEIALL